MRLSTIFAVLFLLTVGCSEEFQGRPPVTADLHYPISVAVDEARGLLYIVNSNFDLAYRAGSVVSVDMDTNRFVEGHVAVGSFPGEFALVSGEGGLGMYGYLAVRGDNSLTWFEVADGSGDKAVSFLCNDDGDADDTDCSGDHVLTEGDYVDPETGDVDEIDLGSDPFGVAHLPGTDGEPDRIVVGAMRGGELTLFDVGEGGRPVLADQQVLLSGLHTVAADPATGIVYVSNKGYPFLYRFEVEWDGERSTLTQLSSVQLPAPYSSAQYARGLAFAGGGQFVLVAYRNPVGILVVHGADAAPEEAQNPVGFIPLDSQPGNVRVFPSGPGGSEMAYVPCFGTNKLWVIDVDSWLPSAIIEVGQGPYDVSAVMGEKMRGYVTNFLDHSVSVLDLDPASPYYHTRIAEIH